MKKKKMQIPVKVKATGEIVDVTINVATAGNPLYTTSGGVTYLGDEIEPAEPDWQHYRIQAAIAAMQAELTNPNNKFMACEDKKAIIARRSVRYADALIKELQKNM